MNMRVNAVMGGVALFFVAPMSFATGTGTPGDTLAIVDGKPITETNLDARAKGVLAKARAEMYEAKKRALDDFLFDYLVEKEAQKIGRTKDQVLKSELQDKIKPVADKDIAAFYDNMKKNAQPGRQMPALEQISDRIKQKLEQDRIQDRRGVYFDQLKKRYKVAYNFTRPRMEVATGAYPAKGVAGAPITIVEFSDFQCPFCKRALDSVNQVMKEYRGKVKLYFRDFPLAFHDKAKPAAIAARCANEQGQFWGYHDKLFAQQKLEKDDLTNYAKELKLDLGKFEACLSNEKARAD
ncbi:MAG TPA: thioredoxin domain-containing protein, partial [Bdellovibrionota bacterium]|nr:thioredoxin domain-containing protein [Bdellovibrionota bacterium]